MPRIEMLFETLRMNRMLNMMALATLVFAIVAPFSATAAAEFVEGEHYEKLPITVDTGDDSRVEVVEVFSYACVHCFNFDPVIDAWREGKEETVDFTRLPAIFNADWELMAQAFYTAQTLGVLDAVHMPIFEGVHVKRQDLRKPDLLADLFDATAEVSAEDFDTAYSSFSVRSRVEQAKAKVRAYRITGVPSIIVNGKYRVDGRMAGSNTKMLEVVEHLIQLEEAAATAAAD